MARAIWSGAISFGLVNVGVKAYSAVHDHEVHFHQLEKKTGARIRYSKVSEKSGKEVDADHIERGYEIDKGTFVIVDPDELEELRPATTRTIDIGDFVDLAEVDPVYYEQTYWLAPDGDGASRAYSLLLAAMEDQQRVGIGSVVMRTKQYLAAIRPLDGALALSTMRFADEIVPQSEIDAIPARRSKPEPRELRLATSIIDSLATDWDPTRYHDTYTEQLRKLIDKKAKGEEITFEEPPAARSNVIDLMAALEASVNAARKGGNKGLARELDRAAADLAEHTDEDDEDDEDDEGGTERPSERKAPKRANLRAGTNSKPTSAATTKKKSATAKKASATRKSPTAKKAATAKKPAGGKAAPKRRSA